MSDVSPGKRPREDDGAPSAKTQRKEARAHQNETVVKVALRGRVTAVGTLSAQAICDTIGKLALHVSRLSHRGALVLRAAVTACCARGEQLPNMDCDTTYKQALKPHSTSITKPVAAIINAFGQHFGAFPDIPDVVGDCQSVTYAAQKLKTAFKNNIVLNLLKRQRDNFHMELARMRRAAGTDPATAPHKDAAYILQCRVNGWTRAKAVEDDAKLALFDGDAVRAFIGQHREDLGVRGPRTVVVTNKAGEVQTKELRADYVDEAWLKDEQHFSTAIKYTWRLLRAREEYIVTYRAAHNDDWPPRIKLFPLTPDKVPKCDFITIDAEVWRKCLLRGAFPRGDKTLKNANKTDLLTMAFDTRRLAGSRNTPTGLIETDGVSVCVHFVRPKTADEQAAAAKKKKKKPAQGTFKPRVPSTNASAPASAASAAPNLTVPARVLGVDPGREIVACIVEALPCAEGATYDPLQRFVLSRSRYNFEIGKAEAEEKAAHWRRGVGDVADALSRASCKTASLEGVLAHVAVWCNGNKICAQPGFVPIVMTEGGGGGGGAAAAAAAAADSTVEVAMDVDEDDCHTVAEAETQPQDDDDEDDLGVVVAEAGGAYARTWAIKSRKCWRHQRFREYMLKRKCIDHFFRDVVNGDPLCKANPGFKPRAPVFAWGDAKFAAAGRGEAGGVPVGALPRHARHHAAAVVGVDEFRTSQKCRTCGAQTRAVQEDEIQEGATARREIRGLKFCPNCEKLLDRDANAAANILACHVAHLRGEARPRALRREEAKETAAPIRISAAQAQHAARKATEARTITSSAVVPREVL